MPNEQAIVTALIAAAFGFGGNFVMEIIKRAWGSRDADRKQIQDNAVTIGDLQRSLLAAQMEIKALSGYADMQTGMVQSRRAKARAAQQ